MRNDKQRAIELRRQGLSYNAINHRLGIPKGTLSDWFSDVPWSRMLRQRLTREAFRKVIRQFRAMSAGHARYWDEWRKRAREEGERMFPRLFRDPLFLVGVTIYWGEGDRKPKNPVRVSNTDPAMLRLFCKFLMHRCAVTRDRIRPHLILYPDLSERYCLVYWSKAVGISVSQFRKAQVIHGRNNKQKKLTYGICVVSVSSGQLKQKLLTWIRMLGEKL